ncbi:MAG: UTP--glucose-1-phosphate uridylyltransferase, partial [Chloroflexi bacterium]|nr:UTP--glucose-1-phosphate uridylyltransferase [Chloroflexota bacterium]
MRAEGLPEIVIETFKYYYSQLVEGSTGFIAERDIRPAENLPDAETFSEATAQAGEAALPKTVFIKLNGGLGTSMGLAKAKSLLPVKEELSFLDIIAKQALQAGARLVLMNSFNTRDDSLAALRAHPALWETGDALDFVQHKIPKVTQASLRPATYEQNPALEWCP